MINGYIGVDISTLNGSFATDVSVMNGKIFRYTYILICVTVPIWHTYQYTCVMCVSLVSLSTPLSPTLPLSFSLCYVHLHSGTGVARLSAAVT